MQNNMRCIITVLVLPVMALAISSLAFSQEKKQEDLAEAEVTFISESDLGGGVSMSKLSNGMTVLIRENHAAPVATVRCYVRNTGSAYEGKYLGMGLSHLVEHLVAGGTTKKRSEKEIQALIDSMGGRTNAYTSNNVTAYFIDCPSTKANLCIELIADYMQYSTFPEAEYLRERGVVQRELEMGDSERGRSLYNNMKQLLFTEHPVRHPTVGYLQVLQRVTHQTVIDFYKSRYVPQNMIFTVVGDVDTKAVKSELLKNFKTFKRTAERGPILSLEPQQASPRETQFEMAGETTSFAVAWPTVRLQHPDLYPLDVASYLLTSGNSSRLMKRLRIEQPLAVSVSSASYTPGYVRGWFEIEVECKPENVAKCKQIIFEEIERLKTELVNKKDLAKVKRQKSAEHVFEQQTVQSQAESLARSFHSTGDPLFDDQYVKGISTVTAEQIQRVAREYFRPERLNTVTIHPQGSGKKSTSQVAEKSESEVIKKKLNNGLTVLLKKHSVLPMVSVQAFSVGGVLADTEQNSGLGALTTKLMSRGTKKYSGDEIAEYFDSIGGSIAVTSQRNTSYLQLQVLKDDYEQSLDYMHQILVHPTFPESEFSKLQQLQLGQIAARKANPQTEVLDYWASLLPEQTPFSRTVLGTQKSVQSLTTKDCRAFHQKVFTPENMVIAIFGDIDIDETLKKLETYYGSLTNTKDRFQVDFSKRHTGKQSAVSKVLTSGQPGTAMVLIGYPTASVLDEDVRAEMQVLRGVLTGGGGRLFQELRGARLVYYVFGFELTGLAPGYFLFMAQTRPETAQEVADRIQQNLEKIKKEGVPADELEKVKQKLISSHAMSNTTASSQAFQAALDELYGLGYAHDKGYPQRIEKVTSASLQKVVQDFFNNPVQVTTSPVKATSQKP